MKDLWCLDEALNFVLYRNRIQRRQLRLRENGYAGSLEKRTVTEKMEDGLKWEGIMS